MIREQQATPQSIANAHRSRSAEFNGFKSPKPTVDIVVKEKYITFTIILIPESSLKGSMSLT